MRRNATNFALGAIPPLFVSQLGRSRWRIDAEVFQTMTTDSRLKHPAVHQSTALVVLTMIRVLPLAKKTAAVVGEKGLSRLL